MKQPVRGDSRQVKVLGPDGTGHRGYVIAGNKTTEELIVLAGTQGEGFVWGSLYLCAVRDPKHWHYVVRRVEGVPQTPDWGLAEAALDDRDGHPDY